MSVKRATHACNYELISSGVENIPYKKAKERTDGPTKRNKMGFKCVLVNSKTEEDLLLAESQIAHRGHIIH